MKIQRDRKFTRLTDLFVPDEAAETDREALVFLDQRGQPFERYSHAQLCAWAARMAQSLREAAPIEGETAVMAIGNQARFTVCFAGLILAGGIPAPLPPFTPRKTHASFERLRRILRDDDIKILILETQHVEAGRALLAEVGLGDVTVLGLDDLMLDVPSERFDPARLDDVSTSDVAYVQYTSGSTSRPKGVLLTHGNVLANLAFMDRVFAREETVRVASWLPLHHDMGLVGGLLTVLYGRGFGVFMPPNAFLHDPARWISMIDQYAINSTATPNFGLNLCVDQVSPDPSWDLSGWRHIFVGAEPVSLSTLERFAEMFAPLGLDPSALRPVYGMAEASLLVAGGAAGLPELRDHVLDRPVGGATTRALLPMAVQEGIAVAIRDPDTGEPLGDGIEGEVHLAGESLAERYRDGSDLATDAGFATGDLGLIQDGQLYITGRKKDVVIVRGRNLSAEDIEELLALVLEKELGGLPTVAVSHHLGDEERLFLFQEVPRAARPNDLNFLKKRISATIIENYGWAPARIVFVPANFLPRTSSNKIMRAACLARFLDGKLKTLSDTPRAEPRHDAKDTDRIAAPADHREDPIVITGMACNFPGASSLRAFWENLCNGVDSITEVPKARWDNDLWYDPRPGIPGKTNTKWGGFVDELDLFDAELFEISPIEARETDPQQRMLLETSWRLLENLGLKKSDLARSNTGVYVGISGADYLHAKLSLTSGLTSHNAYTGLGNAHCIAANRLSYFYDLSGPSMSVDTACSSSLTAFNLAVQAIRFGECDQAIVAGVNTMFTPGSTTVLSQFGMMSPEGRCKTFDASANGYVRSEGCGMVMIKRRSAAIADGDLILAEVLASVSAQDGAGTEEGGGITFPNGAAQDALIARALAQGGLSGEAVSYIESHGTGTAAGDPIEVAQLKRHYGQGATPCWVGGVKANIGHLESAAGIAGLIKTVLVLRHKEIPPQIHLNRLNPRIDLSDSRLAIPEKREAWALPEGERHVAAVSSFGFGGALAHAILSEPSVQPRAVPENPDMPGYQYFPLGISAHTRDGLRATLARVSAWLRDRPGLPLSDISYSFAKGRTPQKHRAAIVARQGEDAARQFDALLADERFETMPERAYHPCFLYSGQGELYAQMGKDFYQRYPVFREAFERCAAVINPLEPGFDLAEYAFAERVNHIDRDRYNLPILFANQHALTTLFAEAGLKPAYVLGHSMGEFAAASAAGAISPEDAIWLLYHRSRAMEDLVEHGSMIVVNAGAEVVAPLLDPDKGRIAAFNGRNRVTIAGQMNHMQAVSEALIARGIKTHALNTNFAFHSPVVGPALDAYRGFLDQVTFQKPRIPWISSVTADFVTEAPTAEHWVDQLSQPVLYAQSLEHLRLQSVDFVEIGPGGACLALALAALGKRDAHHMRTMLFTEKARQEDNFFLDVLKTLYQRGLDLDWSGVFGGNFYPEKLPPQVLDRKRHWLPMITPDAFARFSMASDHDALLPLPDEDFPEAPAVATAPEPEAPTQPDITAQDGWHYTIPWVPVQTPPEGGAFAARAINWMVVGAANPLTEAICRRIKDRGDGCYWIEHGGAKQKPGFAAKLDAHVALADASQRENWHQAIWDISYRWSTQDSVPWKVLFVTNQTEGSGLADLNVHQADGFTHLITLLRELKAQVFFCPVWLITRNTQQVAPDHEPLSPIGAPIWGFGKTLFMEQPEIRGGMIDVDSGDDPAACAALILRKAITPEFEPFVALRGGDLFVQQLKPAPTEEKEMPAPRADGAHIVTGGLGGLGLSAAAWLVDKGARHVILLSRRPLPTEETWADIPEGDDWHRVTRALISLREAGATVEVAAIDIRDAVAVEALFERLDDALIPVRGVIHAAGENWFDLVEDLDIPKLLETLKTKVQASWQLHTLTRDRDLDLFILFSTVSSLWGSSKLSHYTAANHFLDALAELRRAEGLPVTNVNWGPWDDVGMSAKDSEKPTLERLGFYLMPVPDALSALETAIASSRANSMICAINWTAYTPVIKFATQPSFFALVDQGHKPRLPTASKRLRTLLALEQDVAIDAIGRIIRKELQAVTLLENTEEIKGDVRFNIMGMDSLMTLTFAANLENYFQCEFPTTLAYNYPTIDMLAGFIFDVVHAAANGGAIPVVEGEEVETGGERKSWLRPLNTPVEGVPKLICLPFAGSGASAFEGLAKALEGTREVIAAQIPGREDLSHLAPLATPQEIAEKVAEDLREVEGPFVLFGHSMGAILAYELAAHLQRVGQTGPRALILSGADRPQDARREVHTLDDDRFIETILHAYGDGEVDEERRAAITLMKDLLRADITLLETCEISDLAITCPVAAIHASGDNLASREGLAAWASLSEGAFFLTQIEGGHQTLIDTPEIAVTAFDRAERMVD